MFKYLALVLLACSLTACNHVASDEGAMMDGDVMMDEMMDHEGDDAKDGTDVMMEDVEVEVEAPTGVRYEAYSEEAFMGIASKKAIFFHAAWCAKCKKLDEDILGAIEKMPEGTRIFKADYDTDEALKQKYGVVSQDTVVLINPDGSVSQIISGATVDEVKAFFKS